MNQAEGLFSSVWEALRRWIPQGTNSSNSSSGSGSGGGSGTNSNNSMPEHRPVYSDDLKHSREHALHSPALSLRRRFIPKAGGISSEDLASTSTIIHGSTSYAESLQALRSRNFNEDNSIHSSQHLNHHNFPYPSQNQQHQHNHNDQFALLNVTVPLEQDSPAFLAALADSYFPRYRMVLPKRSKILVLDLDETLVHSTSRSSGDCDFMVEVLIEKSSCLYYVYKRPFLDHFLETVSSWFHLVIYTASLREYADPVVNWLDRGRKIFRKRLFRTACLEHEGLYLKDLTLVDHDLSRVCLLDNSPASFAIHPDNGIPIEGWVSEQDDTALLDFLPFLDALRFVEDVRSILSLRRL